MELIDCNKLPVEPLRVYGGLTGAKIAVWYNNSLYMLKSQQRLRDKGFKNVNLNYANDPITEYIGSHIYELVGVPVHETLLGTYNDKLCVLCKDLAYPDTITEFLYLRKSLMYESVVQHSSGMSTKLSDILEVISLHDYIDKESVLYRFWIMFAVDALIGNTDRNNGNWGFLKGSNNKYILCPVYDCGGCLNNKRSDEQMLSDLTNNIATKSINYTFNFKSDNGKRINPFHYMRDNMNPYLQFGVNLVSQLKMCDVIELIQSLGDVLSSTQRLYYITLIDHRLSEIRRYRK